MPMMRVRIVGMDGRDWIVLMPMRAAGPGRNPLVVPMFVVDIAVVGMHVSGTPKRKPWLTIVRNLDDGLALLDYALDPIVPYGFVL